MADNNTTWYLRLKELVSSPLQKLNSIAGQSQRKLNEVANATGELSKKTISGGSTLRKTTGSLEQMNDQLKKLESLQAKAFDPKHVQNYQKAINKVKDDIAAWHKMKEPPVPKQRWSAFFWSGYKDEKPKTGAGDAFRQGFGQMSMGGFNPFEMLLSPKMIAAAGLTLFTTGMVKSTSIAKDYNYGLAKINATAQLTDDSLKKLETRLVDIGSNSGGNFDRIPEAYEKILSVTGKVNGSLDILETSLKGAKAGFTDVDVVGKSLASTMSILGDGTNAETVLDVFMKAKKIGAGEFQDFANYMPGLIASGRVVGMEWKTTAGIFSYMTQKTRDAADATMLMKNVFSALAKKDLLVALEKSGVKVFDKYGATRRMDDIITDLSHKVETMSDKQKIKFFADIELRDAQAKEGFMTLLSDTKLLREQINGVNNSLGETNRQLAMTGNVTRSWGDVGDELKAIGKGIGDILLPIVDALVMGLREIMKDVKNLFTGKAAFFQKANWQSDVENATIHGGGEQAIIKDARMKNARELATKATYEHFGNLKGNNPDKLLPFENFKTRAHWAYFDAYAKHLLNAFGAEGNKNKIVAGEKEDAFKKPLDKLNKVDTTNLADDKTGKSKGNGGLKTLNQFLYITNQIQTKEDQDRLRRKITDDIVDAGRDGLVTLGID